MKDPDNLPWTTEDLRRMMTRQKIKGQASTHWFCPSCYGIIEDGTGWKCLRCVDEVGSPYSTKPKKTTITKNKTKKKTKEISPKAKEDNDKSRSGWLFPGCWLHPGLRFRSSQAALATTSFHGLPQYPARPF